MKTSLYIISVFLPLLLGLCGGCSGIHKAQALNFYEHPAVISLAKDMSKDGAVTVIKTTLAADPTAAGCEVTSEGIQTQQQVTRPALYAPEIHNNRVSSGMAHSDWKGPDYFAQQVQPEQEMTISIFLPFSEINQISIRTGRQKTEILHQIIMSADGQKDINAIVNDSGLNNFLAALYVLCPNLHD